MKRIMSNILCLCLLASVCLGEVTVCAENEDAINELNEILSAYPDCFDFGAVIRAEDSGIYAENKASVNAHAALTEYMERHPSNGYEYIAMATLCVCEQRIGDALTWSALACEADAKEARLFGTFLQAHFCDSGEERETRLQETLSMCEAIFSTEVDAASSTSVESCPNFFRVNRDDWLDLIYMTTLSDLIGDMTQDADYDMTSVFAYLNRWLSRPVTDTNVRELMLGYCQKAVIAMACNAESQTRYTALTEEKEE